MKRVPVISAILSVLMGLTTFVALAGDVEVKLDTSDGGSGLVVKDANGEVILRMLSDGTFLVGEDSNRVPALRLAEDCVIVGGRRNAVSGRQAAVMGGDYNVATNNRAAVAGGQYGVAGGTASFVGGGERNEATGDNSAVLGGSSNKARGDNSVAMGTDAEAEHGYSFVWNSRLGETFASTLRGQFLVSVDRGVGINTNEPAAALHVNGDAVIGAKAPRYGMQHVSLDGSSDTLFTHPAADVTLQWSHATRALSVHSGESQGTYYDVGITRTPTVTSGTAVNVVGKSDDLDGGDAIAVTNPVAHAAGWRVTVVRENASAPGFIFDGTGYADSVGGLVTYWY